MDLKHKSVVDGECYYLNVAVVYLMVAALAPAPIALFPRIRHNIIAGLDETLILDQTFIHNTLKSRNS